jgi:16S rRNA (guanine1207-N2)-methyltransferase
MTDHAFQLLQASLNDLVDKKSLWIVDENISNNDIASIKTSDSLQVITNRYDVYVSLIARGFNALLCDYDFNTFNEKSFDVVFYRISKERAVVHHVINSAVKYLKNDGLLYLSGYKNEGIKTYIGKAVNYCGELLDKKRGSKVSMLATIRCSDVGLECLDDKNYSGFHKVTVDDVSFISKPGIFGWNKIDHGSAFLIEQLPQFISLIPNPPRRIIDLGCGYGYISLMASKLLQAEYIATDNNVAAVNACKENFKTHQVNGAVILDDCAAGIKGSADIILCNPPFHQGFDIENHLTEKFLLSCRRLLNDQGSGLFVVNSFISIEKKANQIFSKVETLANNNHFKLVSVSGPK